MPVTGSLMLDTEIHSSLDVPDIQSDASMNP